MAAYVDKANIKYGRMKQETINADKPIYEVVLT